MAVEIPITNPQLSAQLSDSSKTDESIGQNGTTTVNVGAGASFQQHCGNHKGDKEFTRVMSTFLILLISLICDAFICVFLWQGQSNMQTSIINRFEQYDRNAEVVHRRMDNQYKDLVRSSEAAHQEMMLKAKEGTIWLLRDDLIKSMDFHEATKTITVKQYKRIKDEYDYYTQIGGNHDVKDRFDHFTTKIYGTGEIKMVTENKLISDVKK